MAPKQPCEKYQYVVTSAGPKILPVDEPYPKDEESPADYNAGGYLPLKVNDTFKNGRYKVVRKLGWGHFSTVWLVKDTIMNRHSALKVVKSAGRYAETARDEIKLLSRVASFSPQHPGRAFIVSFLDSFVHQGPEASHVCIVFEPLGENLLALIERNKKKGVPRALVKVVAKQVLLGLQYLHDECDLVHTDIKPENILVSIPDIEAHISSELSQSPSPTSRRVGVPLPTKSRSGMTIPLNQQRGTRRSVQIFESQPLSSPGRSAGLRNSLSMSHGGGSGSNSASGSYVGQMQMSRLSAPSSAKPPSDRSSIPKSSAATIYPPTPKNTTHPAQHSSSEAVSKPPPTSPSTSSSSSSLASTSASTSTGLGTSSLVSTPPTSLSQSLGSAVAGLMSISIPGKDQTKDFKGITGLPLPIHIESQPQRSGIALELEQHSSWTERLASSWKQKLSFSIPSSSKSPSAGSKTAHKPGHNRSLSGVSVSSSWKDPGLAAPAPAVVVSTVVRADGEEEGIDYFQFANSSVASNTTISSSIAKSESSSATVTVARPSPTEFTPRAMPDASQQGRQTDPAVPTNPKPPPLGQNQPSLLSQTAPPRNTQLSSGENIHLPHPSPPHHVSYLSAHMHTHPEQKYCTLEHRDRSPHVNSHRLAHPRSDKPTSPDNTPTISPIPPTIVSALPPVPHPHVIIPKATAPADVLRVGDESNAPRLPPISIKIADLGNATPSKKHYTEDIQTRQYRAPEAILGRKDWDGRADVWSVACVVFELLTAEYLFDPQGQGELFTKDDDHMAQIIELLGDFPLEAKMGGKYSRELFDHAGSLRYIRNLKPWPLKSVMAEKYLYAEEDAAALCEFLEPMLAIDFRSRVNARDMVGHKWMELSANDDFADEW